MSEMTRHIIVLHVWNA